MNEYKHQHPLVIIFYIWKFAILLILPLIRGFIGALTGDFASWARGAWFDILVVCAIFVFGTIKWKNIYYKVTEKDISIYKGMVIKQNFKVPFEKITTFSYINSFVLKPFGCASIYFDTPAGTDKKADMHLFLNKYEAKKLLLLQSCYLGERSYPKGHRTKNWYVLFISALTSNSFAGTVLFATFISQMGEILGTEFSDSLYGQFEQLGEKLSFGLPPTTAAIAYILVAGWFVAFMINVIKYHRFTVSGAENSIYISSGVLTKQEYVLNKEKVTYIDITQTVVTKLLGFISVFIVSIGYGKQKNAMKSLIPVIDKNRYYSVIEHILPDYKEQKLTIRPSYFSIFRFIFFPLFLTSVIFFIRREYLWGLKAWGETLQYISLMAYVPCIWYLIIRFLDFLSCGIGEKDGFFTLCYSKKLTLHKIIINKKDIVSVRLKSSLFQKIFNKCDVIIYSFSEGKSEHIIKNIYIKDAEKIMWGNVCEV